MIVKFTPNPYSNFQFQANLDGTNYINIYTLNNKRILTLPLIGSPLEYDISMTAGYFTTKLIYRESMQQFEII